MENRNGDINPTVVIMTLNVNELNNAKSEVSLDKNMYRFQPYDLYRRHFRCNDTNKLKGKAG